MTRAPSVSPPLHRCCRLAMSLSAAVLLSACSILPSQTPMDTYVLPAPVTQQTPASAGANTGLALRITRPLVDGAIAGRRIVVMPQAGRISVYQGAIWSEPPAQLLRNRLIDAFQADGRLSSISTDEGVMPHADYLLVTQLRAFHSAYENGHPHAVIRLDAQIIRASNNRIVASHSFQTQQSASGKDVPEVVQALGKASDRLSQDVVDWTILQIRTP